MNAFLRAAEARALSEQEARIVSMRGHELPGGRSDDWRGPKPGDGGGGDQRSPSIGSMRGGMATKERAAQRQAERLSRIVRLRGLGLDTQAIAAQLGLTYRQVKFAETSVSRMETP